MEHPKVFISHASEDKERFVIDFATKLRSEQGLDAFVDTWEILPGDSIVDKIFEEGIGQAQAVIVAISEYSVDKPWVRKELNVAVVRKIQGLIKLMAVVIGSVSDAAIPVSLQDMRWERIEDLTDYDAQLNRIAMSIRGQYELPPMSKPPGYAASSLNIIPGLSKVDSSVLKVCCDELVQRDEGPLTFAPQWVYEMLEPLGIHRDNILESLHVLAEQGYLGAQKTIGNDIHSFRVSDRGFDEYLRAHLPDYERLLRSVALRINNAEERESRQIANSLERPVVIVGHLLGVLAGRGLIVTQTSWLSVQILSVSPQLKRWLEAT